MKKLTILFSTALLAGCHLTSIVHNSIVPPHFSAKDFVGTWRCGANSQNWDQIIEQVITFNGDGTENYTGYFTFIVDGYELKYEAKGKNQWRLAGWDLYTTYGKVDLRRNFDAKAKAALKTNANVKAKDKSIYDLYVTKFNEVLRRNMNMEYKDVINKFSHSEFQTSSSLFSNSVNICFKLTK